MNNNRIIDIMTIDGDTAIIDIAALDWNADLLDEIDWNEMASNEADDIMSEAFGRTPTRDDAISLHESEWLNVQKAWPAPSGVVEVPVVRDADGSIDEWETANRMDEAIQRHLEETTHVADDWRETEVKNLRDAYPELMED